MACANCNSGCGCISNYKENDFGTIHAWTKGGSNAGGAAVMVFLLPGADIEDIAPTIMSLQARFTVSDSTAQFKCKVGFQTSADGITWAGDTYFGSDAFQTGNGTTMPDWYVTATNYKARIRFVIWADQVSGTNVEMANVRVVIGFQLR